MSLFVLGGGARQNADIMAFGHSSGVWTHGAMTFVLVSPAAKGDLDSAIGYVM